ncbi:MAG TPA: hypothetical protein VKT30_00440 [Caulobacteraceae bacterium]|nr:hypothetical protein [Caulobacteraceae bacterium]
MISAIIEPTGGGGRLVATFASLTSAAADGLVREVIVVDPTGSAETAVLADEAGATRVGSTADALASARQPWLLVLRAGTRLESGWAQAAWRHIERGGRQAGWFQLSYRGAWPRAPFEEASAALAARFGRLRAEHGLLAPRGMLDRTAPRQSGSTLPARLKRGALRPVGARILAELA